jgi:hypothetical protein
MARGESNGEIREQMQSFDLSHTLLRKRAGQAPQNHQLFKTTESIAEVIRSSLAIEAINFAPPPLQPSLEVEQSTKPERQTAHRLGTTTTPMTREQLQQQAVSTYLEKCEITLSILDIADSLRVSRFYC